MKRILLILCLALASPLLPYGCNSAPSAKVIAAQSLKAVGASAEAAVGLSAQLYRDKKITADQARAVMDFYNLKFQVAFRLAVSAVNANYDAIAPDEIASLAGQLTTLVLSLK